MTTRQVAFAVAKYWGLLPHVVWHYPFRYYVELRGFYLASFGSSPDRDKLRTSFNWDEERFEGEAI
jgi:hypothetical protein